MCAKRNQILPYSLEDRKIIFQKDLPAIPEKLLLAHAKGEVLFVCGAGVSQRSKLPLFRELVKLVYKHLNSPVYSVLEKIPNYACNNWDVDTKNLTDSEKAQLKRFLNREYDIALGLLERDIHGGANGKIQSGQVRNIINKILSPKGIKHNEFHEILINLANRSYATAIVTTNFDLLFERAAQRLKKKDIETYSIGSIPWPSTTAEFSGILHIHGALEDKKQRHSPIIITDEDFGDAYLRRRIVPDFMYDASRIFSVVLVGYTAEDPPMRYLLTSINGDELRFPDIKPRYAFVPVGNEEENIKIDDYRGRGITAIPYDPKNEHEVLLKTLKVWSDFSPFNDDQKFIDKTIKRIVKKSPNEVDPNDRDLFEHLIKRSNIQEQRRHLRLASQNKASAGWIDIISGIIIEKQADKK